MEKPTRIRHLGTPDLFISMELAAQMEEAAASEGIHTLGQIARIRSLLESNKTSLTEFEAYMTEAVVHLGLATQPVLSLDFEPPYRPEDGLFGTAVITGLTYERNMSPQDHLRNAAGFFWKATESLKSDS